MNFSSNLTNHISRTILVRTSGQTAARESRLIVVDQDQQYKITLKIEGKLIGHVRVTNLFAQLISARQN